MTSDREAMLDEEAPYQKDRIGNDGYQRQLIEVYVEAPGGALWCIVVKGDGYQQDEGGVTLKTKVDGVPVRRTFPWHRVIEIRRHAHA